MVLNAIPQLHSITYTIFRRKSDGKKKKYERNLKNIWGIIAIHFASNR